VFGEPVPQRTLAEVRITLGSDSAHVLAVGGLASEQHDLLKAAFASSSPSGAAAGSPNSC
jgi:hypothetical protein